MTILAPDRPGLVRSLSALVTEHNGNWLESRMSRLGGQFAGILRVEVPSEKKDALISSLKTLQENGMTVVVHPDQSKVWPVPSRLCVLDIVGQDRPGIVRQLSQALANHSVNVEELSTECASAAMSGETLFKAHAKLNIPESCDRKQLQTELEKIAADLIIELSLAELPNPASAR